MKNCAQILDWTAWAPGLGSDRAAWARAASKPAFGLLDTEAARPGALEPAAPAKMVPAMQRRRLTHLGRAVAEVLAPLAALAPDAPWVYASRWGDAGLAAELLVDTARNAPLSPAKFATSVHNGAPSLLSIALGCRNNVTALAAGIFSAEAALESAVGLLSEHERVILAVAETKPPEVFDAAGVTHAWGLLLGRQEETADPQRWSAIRSRGPFCAVTTRALAAGETPDPRSDALGGVPADLDVLAWLLAGKAPFLTHPDRHAAWVLAKDRTLSLPSAAACR